MGKFKDRIENENVWNPTMEDVRDLENKLAGKTFIDYCCSIRVLTIDAYGSLIVRNPNEFKRLSDIDGLREWKNEKDQDSFFTAHPEEYDKWKGERLKLFKEVRKKLDLKYST